MSTLATVFIEAVGIAAPGLPDWTTAQLVLRGERPYVPLALPAYEPMMLPANERRRACAATRLAFRVAEQATLGCDTARLAAVFASAEGNLHIAERLCSALASPQRPVSPTDFHASVHNSPVGNWSISTASRQPSTAISGWEDCFFIGLLEAIAMVAAEDTDTLLVAYDLQPPAVMADRSLSTQTFGVALRLGAHPSSAAMARLRLLSGGGAETSFRTPSLAAIHAASPAARSLPLLEALACHRATTQKTCVSSTEDDNSLTIAVDFIS